MKANFLEDDKGNLSSIRLMSFTSLVAALIIAVLIILNPNYNQETGIYLVFMFLLSAFTPKTLQKAIENREKIND